MKKDCKECDKSKKVSEFSINNKAKDGLQWNCKECHSNKMKAHRKTKKGLITKIYTSQVGRSKRRGHNPPTYTRQELKEWLYAQPLFHHLYHLWEISNYDTMLIPSVDRLDDYEPYSFSNIHLITWQENMTKGHNDRKNGVNNKQSTAVVQFTKDGEFIAEYYSIHEAERITGIHDSNIGRCCKGHKHYSHAGGFIWKFKIENEETKSIAINNSNTRNRLEGFSRIIDPDWRHDINTENHYIYEGANGKCGVSSVKGIKSLGCVYMAEQTAERIAKALNDGEITL